MQKLRKNPLEFWHNLSEAVEVKKVSNSWSGIDAQYSGLHRTYIFGRFVKKSGLDRSLLCQLQMGDPVHDGISLLLDELVLYSDRIMLHDIFLEKLSTVRIQKKTKTFTRYQKILPVLIKLYWIQWIYPGCCLSRLLTSGSFSNRWNTLPWLFRWTLAWSLPFWNGERKVFFGILA